MPELTPKPPELLQAQVATFAAEYVKDREDKDHLFNNIGNLAISDLERVARTTNHAEYHSDENGDMVRIPEGTERLVATGEEYVDFMRSVGGSSHEAIQGRTDILKAYSTFGPTIDRLMGELTDPATRKEHPNYLGSGSSSTVFEIDTKGKKYAVRVPSGKLIVPSIIDGHLAGAVLGKGLTHLEQIVAASYEDGVTVAEKMPGKEVGHLAINEINAITDDQLSELVDTLVVAHKRGIAIDPKPSNFLYDPEAGYGIVDYHSSKEAGKNTKGLELGEVVGWGANVISSMGLWSKDYKAEKSSEYYARDLEFIKASLDVLNRYGAVVKQKLASEEQEKALKEINSGTQFMQETTTNYSDPAWVMEQVAKDKEWARQASKKKTGLDGWITV